MDQKQIRENQMRVFEIMKNTAKEPQRALDKLVEFEAEALAKLTPETAEYYVSIITIFEAKGDCFTGLKKIHEAEQAYKSMVQNATKFYEMDKEKNDYPLGASYLKLANFYRLLLGCHQLLQKPRELNESQKKAFDIAEQCYKSCLGCTMENAKKGNLQHVDLHAVCLEALMVFFGSVGDYQKASLFGKDAVRLNKNIYEKKDDKQQAVRLANVMNGLAAIYMFSKNPQLAMENLEDAVYVLEAHEAENDMGIGTMLARYYISLGSCYQAVEEEKDNAEDAYKQGLNRMVALNDKSNNRMVDDVIQSYMFVAEYYAKQQKELEAKAHYAWVMKLASDMFKATKNPKYENLMKSLKSKV